MKSCPKCFAQCDDSAAFCKFCGMKLDAVQSQQEQQSNNNYQQPVNTNYQPQMQMNNYPPQQVYNGYQPQANYVPATVPPATPAIGVLKKAAASPLFIISTIAVTLVLLVNIITKLIYTSGGIFASLYSIADYFDIGDLYYIIGEIEYELYDIFGSLWILEVVAKVGTVIGLIPTVLVTVGLWMTFAAGVNKRSSGFKTTGLTILKVINTITLVFVCIGWGLGSLFVLLSISVVGLTGIYGGGVAVAVVAFLLAAVYAVLQIIYYAKINKTINAVKYTALTGNGSREVSTYLAVICFIAALGNLFTIILSPLTSIFNCTALVCFGVLIFVYRNDMHKLAYTPMPLNTSTNLSYNTPAFTTTTNIPPIQNDNTSGDDTF